jgi:hypothetical protein
MARSDSNSEAEARRQIAEAEEAEARDRASTSTAARLFDLRRLIGGLLTLYGALLTVMGLFGSAAIKSKAAGVNINLWAGLGILVGGLLFLAWVAWRPLRAVDLEADAEADADQGARVE